MRFVRKENGRSAEYVARQLGVHGQTYRRWESGESKVPYDEFCRMMALFGYDVLEVKNFREATTTE
jgi:transcriptional regulator with XRE-family HTH domain